jgi:omega-hydroxy-beta-dihydromenaquinone-9 sulfotransferase
MQHGLLSNGCAPQLARWLVEQPQLQPRWATRLALRHGSFWFEHLLKSQNNLYHVPATDQPHFVMGFWRSGTTLLHNRIYAASQSSSPLSWECFNPSSFRLRRRPTTNAIVKRPMDEGQISTFGPQEDEFALMLLGEPSLYRAFLHPSRFLELIDEAKSSADADYPRWYQFLSLVQRDECRPLILKSPNHWLRLPMIARTFPAAKQVWVGRDFAKTYLSNINMWTEMARIHALSEWRLPIAIGWTCLSSIARPNYCGSISPS